MKKSILSVFALLIGISVSAQKVSKTQSSNIDPYASLQKQRVVGETNSSTLPYRPDYKPVSKSLKSAPGVEEILIGGTVYDTQTNSAVANRIYAYPDGTIGTVWTMGFTAPAIPNVEPVITITTAAIGALSLRPVLNRCARDGRPIALWGMAK
jgi:hypothetical protein